MSDQGSQTEETSLPSSEEIATQTDDEEREGTHSSKSAANKNTPTNEVSQKIDDLECTIQILHEQLEKLANENISSSVCPDCKCNRAVLDCKQDSCNSKVEPKEANTRQAENFTEISRQQKKGDVWNDSGHGDVGLCLSGGGRDGPVKVLSISPDGPIGRSGAEIPIGSRIVSVDARKVELEHEASQVLEWLRGPNGSSVQIDLMKPEAGKDDEIVSMKVVRGSPQFLDSILKESCNQEQLAIESHRLSGWATRYRKSKCGRSLTQTELAETTPTPRPTRDFDLMRKKRHKSQDGTARAHPAAALASSALSQVIDRCVSEVMVRVTPALLDGGERQRDKTEIHVHLHGITSSSAHPAAGDAASQPTTQGHACSINQVNGTQNRENISSNPLSSMTKPSTIPAAPHPAPPPPPPAPPPPPFGQQASSPLKGAGNPPASPFNGRPDIVSALQSSPMFHKMRAKLDKESNPRTEGV
ncbi:hypothetical protein GUITHDRAFT_135053 [Guillardia theta CCMP2712]|uniref:PDZ domain-containing protein n=1 Tax=Guillardia theta (strain CCMP2712) TaxID=905079 RepID=L1JQZ9_GUITC|nr:hypothetical protein GUITHDRAFT_135053 [Guillardia theta CCMP2712]EKX50991.1 hypothetical protein GUITHDRAFT_135053 [Guillardia theta CCMP2712]|eukprot:XP_005837971.1 hypothetical protein GUITHDRAFT_135053 [Guillardia theta CCMP2712]